MIYFNRQYYIFCLDHGKHSGHHHRRNDTDKDKPFDCKKCNCANVRMKDRGEDEDEDGPMGIPPLAKV